MTPQAAGQKRHIVIVGGGIIGATTAYFLTRHPKYDPSRHQITLLEATAIAAGASGKAGGLLALWAYPQELVPLSYRLHEELAAEFDGATRWGYRRVGCGHVQVKITHDVLKRRTQEVEAAKQKATTEARKKEETQKMHPETEDTPQKVWEKLPKQDEHASNLLSSPSAPPADLDYIDRDVVQFYQQMGETGTHDTAQVHPLHFTRAMVELAEERGVEVRLGAQVTRIIGENSPDGVHAIEYRDRNNDNALVLLDDNVTDIVVTAGPWTGVVLPHSKVEGLRAHSVVWNADVAPYAIFTDVTLPSDYVPEHRLQAGQRRRAHAGGVDPEIYARPFGEVYACGEPDSSKVPLPATADAVTVDEVQCADLEAYVGTVSTTLAAAPVITHQACYLPRHMRFGDEQGPLIGRTRTQGLWVAAGHTCWGIQNGPATGCLMAELLLDGQATSADISKLDPRRFKV